MRYMLVGATATMALLGAAVLATAQAQDDKNKGPGAESQGRASEPRTGESERSKQPAPGPGPKAEQRDDRSRKGAEKGQDTDRPKATEQRQDRDRPKSTQQQDKDSQKSTQDRQDRDKDRQKSTQQQQQDRDRAKSTQERQDKDRPKATQQQQDRDRAKSTQERQDKDRPKATQQQQDKDRPKTTEGSGKRAKVSEQQRSSAGKRIREQRVERVSRSRINVNVRVGARLPRSVHLHVLPVFIYDDVPDYRGYSYVLLEDDTILIVDANTYEIIDVIPAGSLRADRPGGGSLTLSAEQMRFVFANVRRDRIADVRVRLALGAEVPRDVELLAFPGEVIGRIGELQRYRYIVADGEVAIVDPDDHAVVLVITD